MIRIRPKIQKRWQQQIREATTPLTVLSPYITRNKTLKLLAEKKATFYTRFEVRDFASKASTLAAIKLLLDNNCKIYEIKDLHAKVIMDETSFVTVGSQNLTARGASENKELSACFDGETRNTTCERVREVVSAWIDDPELQEIDWIRFDRMKVDVGLAKEAFKEFDKAMRKIQVKTDKAQAERLKSVEEGGKDEREARKAATQTAIKKAIAEATPSNIHPRGTVRAPRDTTPKLHFNTQTNLYRWKKNGKPLEDNSRCLCLLDEETLGWVRLASKQITRVAQRMNIGSIFPKPFGCVGVTLSVEKADLKKAPANANIVAILAHHNTELCRVALDYWIDGMSIEGITYPKRKATGKKPTETQHLRSDLASWLEDDLEGLKLTFMTSIASTTPLPYRLDGDDAKMFFGPVGTEVDVTMKFINNKRKDPILVATRVCD